MKKLLLCGSALLFSLGVANAQVGYQTKGGHDDFATTNEYVDAVSGKGLYWYDNTGATTIKLTRTGGGAGMDINVTNAGGCRSGSNCYPSFGLNFGSGVTMDLSQQADMTFDIANQVNAFTWITVILTDANGKTASYEPNVSDVLPTTTWSDPSQPRKALNGFTYTTNNRVTVKLDLTNGGTNVGGLTAFGTSDCSVGPYHCPNTDYEIDPTKISSITFMVNFGADDIFVSEGDGDYTIDTFIKGTTITPYTGGFTLYDFKIGTLVATANTNSQTDNSLSVYPNPATDMLNISFDAGNSAADVTLTDMVGNKVFSTTATSGTNQIAVNTSKFTSGIYILNIASENGKSTRKVTIK